MAEQEEKTGQQLRRRARGGLTPFDELDRMLEAFFGGPVRSGRWGAPSWGEAMPFEGRVPSIDVQDLDNEIKVRAELPGVKKDDLEVSVSEGSVTIKASTHREETEGEERGNYYRREIATGSFARTLALPADVSADQARARFEDGVLELTLPKREAAKGKRVPVE